MNILTDEFPDFIKLDNCEYAIDSDFRNCLKIILAFEDNNLAAIEKQAILVNRLYKEKPDDISEAIIKGVEFLNANSTPAEDSTLRLYSFEKDAPFIFAAFRQTHGIDLEKEKMHWWKFLALFMDLGSETTFSNLIGLRKRVKTGKATKEERAASRELGDLFDLPEIDTHNLEELEAERKFMEAIGQKNA